MFSRFSKHILCGVILVFSAAAVNPVQAASPATTTLAVTLKITADCSVQTDPVAFGEAGSLQKDIDAEGTVRVACSPGVKYKIGLNTGTAGATVDARKMSQKAPVAGQTAATIAYQLYLDPARTQVWGAINATGASVDGTQVVSTGTETPYTVYGRVAKSATTPPAGDYSDTVGVTVEYQ